MRYDIYIYIYIYIIRRLKVKVKNMAGGREWSIRGTGKKQEEKTGRS